MLQNEKDRAMKILTKHRNFYRAVVDALMNVKDKEVTPRQFQSLAQDHGLAIEVQRPKDTIYADYKGRFVEFTTFQGEMECHNTNA